MRLQTRALIVISVAIAAVLGLAACVPIPPQPPQGGQWTAGPGCITGGQHTFGSSALDWPHATPIMGTIAFKTRVCFGSYGEILSIENLEHTCTPKPGYTASGGVSNFTAVSREGHRTAECTFRSGSAIGTLRDTHTWTSINASAMRLISCAKHTGTTGCAQRTRTYDAYWEKDQPTTPPATRWVQGTRVTTDGSALPSSTVTVDGTTVSNGTNGSFEYTLPNDFPSQHTVTVSVPSGYSVAYTACSNKTTCHSGKTPTPGNSVTANPDPGKYLDVRWYFTRTGTIQGFKMIDHIGASVSLPAVQALWVKIDGQRVSEGPINPYVVGNLTAGNHLVQVEAPAGWYMGYTLCFNDITCHNDPVHEWTDRVNVNVPAGGFADLYWHYYQCPNGVC